MRTLFNLVGYFTKQTRFGTRIQEHHSVIVLRENMTVEECNQIGYGNLEHVANQAAVAHTKHTPKERMWMTDWELQSHAETGETVKMAS